MNTDPDAAIGPVAEAESALREAMASVTDPTTDLGIVDLGMVRSVELHLGAAAATLATPCPVEQYPEPEELAQRVRDALGASGLARSVDVRLEGMDDAELSGFRAMLDAGGASAPAGGRRPADPEDQEPVPTARYLARTTRVLAISSGKGGVGKSSVTVNLAVSLAETGASVGLLDADIYGFSVPGMLGIDTLPVVVQDVLLPPKRFGVRCISVGFFLDDAQPVLWRGPMLHKALTQLVGDVYWARPDYLVVDMPPGTGDVALSMAELIPGAEFYVVTTPQPAAERVAQRSAIAARSLKLPVRGVIENMSWFTGDDGKRYEIFGNGGGVQLASALDVDLLAQLPLVAAVREGADQGTPAVAAAPDSEVAIAFRRLAQRIVSLGPTRRYRRELKIR